MIVKRLSHDKLVVLIDNIFYPAGKKLSTQEIDKQLICFCLNCPDPGEAMNLIVEAPRGALAIDVVNQALDLPLRDVSTWPAAELSMDHPLRHWKLEE